MAIVSFVTLAILEASASEQYSMLMNATWCYPSKLFSSSMSKKTTGLDPTSFSLQHLVNKAILVTTGFQDKMGMLVQEGAHVARDVPVGQCDVGAWLGQTIAQLNTSTGLHFPSPELKLGSLLNLSSISVKRLSASFLGFMHASSITVIYNFGVHTKSVSPDMGKVRQYPIGDSSKLQTLCSAFLLIQTIVKTGRPLKKQCNSLCSFPSTEELKTNTWDVEILLVLNLELLKSFRIVMFSEFKYVEWTDSYSTTQGGLKCNSS